MAVGIGATILDVHTSRLNGCCWQIRRPVPDEGGTLRAAATPFRACRDTRAGNDMSDQKNRDLQLFRYFYCFRLGVAFICLFVSLSFGAPSPLPWWTVAVETKMGPCLATERRKVFDNKETERKSKCKRRVCSVIYFLHQDDANLRTCVSACAGSFVLAKQRFLCRH